VNKRIVTLMIGLLLVTACGGGSAAAPTASPAGSSGPPAATKTPTTLAELALYQGPDRQQLLVAGAKAEGQLVYYTSNSTQQAIANEFMKKYPDIKVQVLNAQDTDIRRRLSDEYQANNVQADILEMLNTGMDQLRAQNILQEYWTPELTGYDDSTMSKGKNGGVYWLGDRAGYTVLGYNTNLISASEAPKTYDDLLDPKWKGKMSVATSSLANEWVGDVLETKGAAFFTKLKDQQIKAQNVSVASLLNLVISGEVPLTPTGGLSNIVLAQAKKAPVAYVVLEPVHTTLGVTAIVTKARHPNAALLFMDFIHSKASQEFGVTQGSASPRNDVQTPYPTNFQKFYPGAKYNADTYPAKYQEWQDLFNKTFIATK
jgi:iron(III) transport system substrate-binding protein